MSLLDRLLGWLFGRLIDFDALLEGTLAFWASIGDGEGPLA